MEWTYNITILPEWAGLSIKDLLTQWRVPKRVRGALRMRYGFIINGRSEPGYRQVSAGDQVTLTFYATDFRTSTSVYSPNDEQSVTILYENEDLVVTVKPAEMKMHPHSPTETDTILNYLAADFKQRGLQSRGQPAQPFMVHRLDRATSGVVLVAKNPVVVPMLDSFLADKTIQRTYYAWVSGQVTATAGTITAPIGIHPGDDRLRVIDETTGLSARTDWQIIEHAADKTLLAVQLATGRTHQIRVHLQSIGHPIIGDEWYNPTQPADRLMLHAKTIAFPVPFTTQVKSISSDLPTVFDLS
jgi:23S rRNA pseudouridine1911/1915/1917 synthase